MGPPVADEATEPTPEHAPPPEGEAGGLGAAITEALEGSHLQSVAAVGDAASAVGGAKMAGLPPYLPGTPDVVLIRSSEPGSRRPTFLFFGIVASLSLAADIASKVWAEMTLNQRGFEPLELIKDHLSVTLAYNRGGAWGLFSTASDMVRKPFFLGVSIAAIAFIISLYARLTAKQKALKWGLPLVLGGALGNLNDRITRSQVIDFIDFRADWIMDLNVFVHRYVKTWAMTDHWPTFNVADVAICIGVGLMAVDMFTHRPRRAGHPLSNVAGPGAGPDAGPPGSPEARPEAPPAMG
jgi:signal peptidase II